MHDGHIRTATTGSGERTRFPHTTVPKNPRHPPLPPVAVPKGGAANGYDGSGLSNRNWNDPLPLLALALAELFYGAYVVIFGMHALPFCLFLAGAHVIYTFGNQGYCVWKESSYVPKWLGRVVLVFFGAVWGAAGILMGNRDALSVMFGK